MIQKIGNLSSYGGPLLVDRIITDSVTVAVGDSVKTVANFAALGTAGVAVLGHVESIFSGIGISPLTDGSTGAALGSYLGNIGSTYTAASDNETVAKVSVRVDVDKNSLYSAEVDAALGTTTGSSFAGRYFNLVDENTLDESTASATFITLTEGTPNVIAIKQYGSHGVDRNETDNVVVNITNSEVFGI